MRRELGVVVGIRPGVATIHYVDCHQYRASIHRHLPIPGNAKVRLCKSCRPDPDDVLDHPPAVRWYEWSPDGRSKRQAVAFEWAEKIAARRDLGWGKRGPLRTEGWSE